MIPTAFVTDKDISFEPELVFASFSHESLQSYFSSVRAEKSASCPQLPSVLWFRTIQTHLESIVSQEVQLLARQALSLQTSGLEKAKSFCF